MQGNNWQDVRTKYSAFVPHPAVREDLTKLTQWMLSELSVGHSREGGGETLAEPKTIPGGLLGADYSVENGRYRFKKVYGGLEMTSQPRAARTERGVDMMGRSYQLA